MGPWTQGPDHPRRLGARGGLHDADPVHRRGDRRGGVRRPPVARPDGQRPARLDRPDRRPDRDPGDDGAGVDRAGPRHARLDPDQPGLADERHLGQVHRRLRRLRDDGRPVADAPVGRPGDGRLRRAARHGRRRDVLRALHGAARVLHRPDRRARRRRQVDRRRGRHRVRGAVPATGPRRPAADRERALADVDRVLGVAGRQGRARVDPHADRLGDLDDRPDRRGEGGVRPPGALARPSTLTLAGRLPGGAVRRFEFAAAPRPIARRCVRAPSTRATASASPGRSPQPSSGPALERFRWPPR